MEHMEPTVLLPAEVQGEGNGLFCNVCDKTFESEQEAVLPQSLQAQCRLQLQRLSQEVRH
jgi:hypothetical protein